MVRFLYLGQIRQQKGVGDLVDAAKILARAGYHFHVELVGPYAAWDRDNYGEALRNTVASDSALSEYVSFYGATEDVNSAFQRNLVHIAPSIVEEAYGLVVVEAKSNRRPSIIYPSGGMQELIQNGIDGIVCAEKTAQCLAEVMQYFLDTPENAATMGSEAYLSLERLKISKKVFELEWRSALHEASGL